MLPRLSGVSLSPRRSPALDRLDLVFRTMFAAFAAVVLIPLVSAAALYGWPPGRTVATILAVAATLMTVVRWPAALAVLVMLAATAVAVPEANTGAGRTPQMLLGLSAFILVLSYRLRAVMIAFTVVAVVYISWSGLAGPPGGLMTGLDDVVITAVLTFTGSFFFSVLLHNGAEIDRVRRARVEAELDASFLDSHAAAMASSRRLLHDEVIGTLATVADYRATNRDGYGDEIRRACARVAGLLAPDDTTGTDDDPRAHGALHELVADTVTRSDLEVDLAPGPAVALEDRQRDAVGRALAEALRNVRRHAGVDAASISWAVDGGVVHLQVSDQGTAPRAARDARRTAPFGLRHSIEEPMAEIGGQARLALSTSQDRQGGQDQPHSNDGHDPQATGSTVTLTWPTRAESTPSQSTRAESTPSQSTRVESTRAESAQSQHGSVHADTMRAIGQAQRVALWVVLPVLLGHGWLAVRYAVRHAHPLAELTLVAVIMLATVAVAVRLRHAPLPRWSLVALAGGVAAAVHLGVELAGGHQTLSNYNSYVIGLASVVLTVAAFFVPLAWALALTVPTVAVVIAHAVLGGLTMGQSGGAINAILAPPVLGYIFGAYLRWTRQRQDEEEQRVRDVAAEVHRRQAAGVATSRHLARARRLVAPWLREVAAGRVALDAPETASRARNLAVAMRDDLHLPGVLDAALSSRIDRCRSGGLEVVLEAMDAEVDVDRAAPCLRLLDRILDLEEKLDAVMVRLPDVGGGPGQVRVLPPLALPDLEAVLRGIEGGDHDVRHDHFSTVVRVGDLQQSPDAEVVTPW